MNGDRAIEDESAALRERLSRLTEASLRINESLDLDTVLQGVLDSARSLTEARYALITTLDGSGQVEDFLVSGLTPGETRQLWQVPGGLRFFEYLSGLPEPLRVGDFAGHIRAMGMPQLRMPAEISSFLAAPIRHRGENVGNIYVAKQEPGLEFSHEDEETLVMFASQVALVIANARRYREERRARTDLEALVNTSPVGVAVFDARTGAAASMNREARRIVSGLCGPGETAEDLLRVLTLRRADGQEVSLADFPLSQALRAGETVRAEEIVLSVPGGSSVSTLLNATPILAEDGEIDTFVVTLQDLAPLEDMERLRAEFLGMVSHELRTPLTSIKGSADTLLEASAELDPAEMAQFHRIIRDQSENMRYLISDLLDVARIETGTLPVSPEPAEVAELVDEARSRFPGPGGRSNLRMELAADLPRVMADRRRIVQVLGNLLSNAARHSHEASPITVRAATDGLHVAVSVADEGRGISPERLPQLFRKFSRLDAGERDGDLEGSGLGLAICKGIVEAHGGRIWAESEGPDLGSRFTFTLPAVEETAAASPTSRQRPGGGNRTRVLAVDDDPQTLRLVRDSLTRAGYAPIVTGDPEEVIPLVERERPHLVLLDLVLPGSDGIELMREILERHDLPVVFLSAYGQEEVIARALDLGAADYVVKPFAPTELAARIRAALRRRAAPELAEPSEPFRLGDLAVDYPRRSVTLGERPVPLTDIEYRLLTALTVNAGRVLTHDQLLQRVWGPGQYGDPAPVRNIVKRLRRKLGDNAGNPSYIFNEPRVGYRVPRGEEPV